MKRWIQLAVVALCAIVVAACGRKSVSLEDFDKPVYMLEYASGFDIKGADSKQSVLLTVTNPWQGADGIAVQLFIARDGETAPEGFDGQVLEGDADRIVAMSSTHIAMLDAIGEVDRVVGVSASTTSPIPTFRRAATASATWATKGISTMNCCCRSIPTSCCSTA